MSDKELSLVEQKKMNDTLIAIMASDTMTEAAKRLGCTRETLYNRVNRYGLKDKLNEIKGIAVAELTTSSAKAARNLIDKLDSEDESISIKASTEVLNRAGVKGDSDTTVNINFNKFVEQEKDHYGFDEV